MQSVLQQNRVSEAVSIASPEVPLLDYENAMPAGDRAAAQKPQKGDTGRFCFRARTSHVHTRFPLSAAGLPSEDHCRHPPVPNHSQR